MRFSDRSRKVGTADYLESISTIEKTSVMTMTKLTDFAMTVTGSITAVTMAKVVISSPWLHIKGFKRRQTSVYSNLFFKSTAMPMTAALCTAWLAAAAACDDIRLTEEIL